MAEHSMTLVEPDGGTGERDPLVYRDEVLHIEGVRVDAIAQAVATPFYCYSSAAIREAYGTLSRALSPIGVSVCFAVKANCNVSVLGLLAELGSGMDIVSGGELERALAAGVPASKIIFSGVGKKRAEIARALEVGIHQINVESAAELDVVISVAAALDLRAPVALRVNPDVDAHTHSKISTGRREDKFGIAIEMIPALFAKAAAAPELDVVGLAVHIGSQILDLTPYREAYSRMADLVASLRSRGLPVHRLDLGGGIGILYDQNAGREIGEYAEIVRETVGDIGCELTVEPGRWLVGPGGVLVTEVLYVKETGDRLTAIVDAGMNDLMRPALYGAVHPVLPLRHDRQVNSHIYQIAGPVCESSDVFGTYAALPPLQLGDRLVFGCAGAYGASMASTYNSRDLAAEVLVDGDRFRVIRRRQTIEAMLALEEGSEWQIPRAEPAKDVERVFRQTA
ncbi:diaminopimelate decarboxylase [Mesorhizobium sp. B4-1-4]|uniref:diaminopimelate decarboxylase n=1 Tax=Mesorhizobium sp. B4-1-4 TaxID=2589888 RepID=UPI001D029ECD|nr:diaminopimelate decarboxylase [Mesorhizobium sp. B4-1-4]UCI32026.1 diaminopimelate decarboxylase [Mesorhizobium sp. B4-1-4]